MSTKNKNLLDVSLSENYSLEEHLTLDRLNIISSSNSEFNHLKDEGRPKSNFVELMNWVTVNYSKALKDKNNLTSFIHNRIMIDGQFLKFCEDKNIKITCLDKESIVSWKSDHNNYEKFFGQGVFLVKSNNVEFIHAALFHKGNQYEDEISFFIILSDKNYLNYLKLRNEFDNWIQQRDRGNLHIKVMEGEDIPYTKESSWEDLFLPEDTKKDIRNIVENFLSSKEFYLNNKIPWKRGVLLYGDPGNGKTSIIRTIISSYNFKPVTISSDASNESIREAFSYAEEQSPSLLYFEDLDSLLQKIDISSFLNLMDGITAKNGLFVIATANNVNALQSNITDRPSRFDRKFKISLPNKDMSFSYLKKWFGNIIPIQKIKELSILCVKYKFSYGYLKELYISSMFEALSNNRKVPTEKDIIKTLNVLMKDKNLLSGNRSINLDKYTESN